MKNNYQYDIWLQAAKLTQRAFQYFKTPHNKPLFNTIREEYAERLTERQERKFGKAVAA